MARGGPCAEGVRGDSPPPRSSRADRSVARPRRPVCPSCPPTEPVAGILGVSPDNPTQRTRRCFRQTRCFSNPTLETPPGLPRAGAITPGNPRLSSFGPPSLLKSLPVAEEPPVGSGVRLAAAVGSVPLTFLPRRGSGGRPVTEGYLVDPASSICLSQRLSHACLSTNGLYSETAKGSLNQLWFL